MQDFTLEQWLRQFMPDFPANPIHKSGYHLEWYDEFNNATLDTRKWFPYHLPQWGSRQRSQAQYAFRDGGLVLQITETQAPWSPEFDGAVKASSLQTGVYSGPVGSSQGQLHFTSSLTVREAQAPLRLYSPQYGYFECRAKCCSVPGNHVSLWLIGFEEDPTQSGEIAMFEVFGKDLGSSSVVVCYGVHPWGDPALHDEFYRDTLEMDATDFHVYAFEWTPTHIDFFVDNQHLRRVHQSPAYPLQLMLSLFELPGGDAQAKYPKEFVVDYVRVYQPEGGY